MIYNLEIKRLPARPDGSQNWQFSVSVEAGEVAREAGYSSEAEAEQAGREALSGLQKKHKAIEKKLNEWVRQSPADQRDRRLPEQ